MSMHGTCTTDGRLLRCMRIHLSETDSHLTFYMASGTHTKSMHIKTQHNMWRELICVLVFLFFKKKERTLLNNFICYTVCNMSIEEKFFFSIEADCTKREGKHKDHV